MNGGKAKKRTVDAMAKENEGRKKKVAKQNCEHQTQSFS